MILIKSPISLDFVFRNMKHSRVFFGYCCQHPELYIMIPLA